MSRLQVEALSNDWLKPCGLEVAAGECVVISGPSGAGKSLLLRAIADLDPHSGHVIFNDRPYTEIVPVEWRRQVGLLAAESAWWDEKVGDHMPGVDTALLDQLGFTREVLGWKVARLSTGEKQRLALARLLANHPAVLLLDEPTANLDAENIEKVEAIILDYCRNTPAAVIWVSHDPAQRARIADRQYRFSNGQLLAVAS